MGETTIQKPKRSLTLRAAALALLLALSGAGLHACKAKEQGPLERAGEKVDEKVDDAKRAVEDAAD